ncbi:MAG: hypothetical protein ACFCBV_07445 [Phycisphaerales bacterium]
MTGNTGTADGNRRPPAFLGWRLLLIGVIVGVVLAIASVPASAFIAQHWLGYLDDRLPATGSVRSGVGVGHVTMHHQMPGMGVWVWHHVVPEETYWPIPDVVARDPSPWWAAGVDSHAEPQVQTMAAGWPIKAARHVTAYDDASVGPGQTRGEYNTTILGKSRLIPTEPLWLGLMAHTFFYAGLIIGGVVLACVLRWAHRRRRSRCIACGYDVSGGLDVCPECGCPVPVAARGEGQGVGRAKPGAHQPPG